MPIPQSEFVNETRQGPSGEVEFPVVALVDSRPFFRELIASFLRLRMADHVIHQACSISEIHSRHSFAYRVFLLFQPTAAAELAKCYLQLAGLRQSFPDAPVIVVSDLARGDLVREAFRSGASGFIPTDVSLAIFAQAIRTVLAGGQYVPFSVLLEDGPMQSGAPAFGKLGRKFTARQQQVLDLLREGLPNKLIAHRLGMCESTVKVHLRHIMRKMNATNRTQVVAAFSEGNWLQTPAVAASGM